MHNTKEKCTYSIPWGGREKRARREVVQDLAVWRTLNGVPSGTKKGPGKGTQGRPETLTGQRGWATEYSCGIHGSALRGFGFLVLDQSRSWRILKARAYTPYTSSTRLKSFQTKRLVDPTRPSQPTPLSLFFSFAWPLGPSASLSPDLHTRLTALGKTR
jgi:hypothetical protein